MEASKAGKFLVNAAATVDSRRERYGDPVWFFREVAKRWTVTLGIPVTPEQVVRCLIDIKLQRLCHDPEHADSVLDIAGYAACLEEIRSK